VQKKSAQLFVLVHRAVAVKESILSTAVCVGKLNNLLKTRDSPSEFSNSCGFR
jgi:hypothetical protein